MPSVPIARHSAVDARPELSQAITSPAQRSPTAVQSPSTGPVRLRASFLGSSAVGGLLAVLCLGTTCCPAPQPATTPSSPASEACASVQATRLPGIDVEQESLETWLSRLPEGEADRALLDLDSIHALNEAAAAVEGSTRELDDPAISQPEQVRRQWQERIDWLANQLNSGKYVETAANSFAMARTRIETAVLRSGPQIFPVREPTYIRCIPMAEGLFAPPIDPDFDRNNCSTVQPGEYVRVLADDKDGRWLYVHAGHSVGWVLATSQLSPALSDEAYRKLRTGPRIFVHEDNIVATALQGGRNHELRLGASFPLLAQEDQAYIIAYPGATGPESFRVQRSAQVSLGPKPLTRRSLWAAAFDQLGQPYGWGGRAGARDCSRYLLDLYRGFGIELGRHSLVQAKQGQPSLDLSGLDDHRKLEQIRRAAQKGTVLLYMPGHIMLYLGDTGPIPSPGPGIGHRDFAISAISGFMTKCGDGQDQLHRIDRTTVSDLEVGRGTERRAFIERINRIAVLGG